MQKRIGNIIKEALGVFEKTTGTRNPTPILDLPGFFQVRHITGFTAG